jgi:hypothetical protein
MPAGARGFRQSLQAIRPRVAPFTSFLITFSRIVLPFDATKPELLKASNYK